MFELMHGYFSNI